MRFQIALLAVCLSAQLACTSTEKKAASAWQLESQTRRDAIEKAIQENRPSYDAFDTGSLGAATLEMIPWVVFRVLQDLESSTFGGEALYASGFFARKDLPSGHNGIIWTQPVAADAVVPPLRYLTRTCSSCHVGRVRLADGSMRLLRGAPNTEINLHAFIHRLTSTLKANLGPTPDSPEYQAFRKRILDSLASHEPAWFYGAGSKTVTPEDAAKEVASVTANIDAVLARMRAMNDQRLGGIALLQTHSYDHAQKPPSLSGGAPGLVETSGLGSVGLVKAVGVEKAALVLPPSPSKADIPAVWRIDSNGYANWDGTIRGFARSLTSSMAVVGDPSKIDIPTNVLIQGFLGKLPPEPYPFEIDDASRKRGEAAFKTNCAGCHARPQGRKRSELVFDVGSDMSRANAILPTAATLLGKVVLSICPKNQPECAFDAEGPVVDPSSKRGYVAGPLDGVWAAAPYLHNGSVPTLRQLLVPSTRTTTPFLRGSTSYIQQDGGWEWQPAKEKELRSRGDVTLALHDPSETGFAPTGHGSADAQYIVDGKGRNVRIAWTDSPSDRAIVDDLIAYLLSM